MPDNVKAIIEMKFNLLLNLARCHRKLEVIFFMEVKFFPINFKTLNKFKGI